MGRTFALICQASRDVPVVLPPVLLLLLLLRWRPLLYIHSLPTLLLRKAPRPAALAAAATAPLRPQVLQQDLIVCTHTAPTLRRPHDRFFFYTARTFRLRCAFGLMPLLVLLLVLVVVLMLLWVTSPVTIPLVLVMLRRH